jgi:hypothetical protein
MSVIKQYRTFKDDLRGFAEVSFDEFRKSVLPLRAAREWDSAATEYAASLLNAGAGRALQHLCGAKHPAATKILGEAELKADPMAKAELDDYMRGFTKNCITGGWSPEWYIAFAAYLDSGVTPNSMAERAREAHRREDEEARAAGAPWAQDAGEPALADNEANPPTSKDRFAEMYRAASPAFKRVVKEHLVLAAVAAQPR